jgi:Pyruvate/2-oxoacid:ferredoxin oxidoreductase gamma subunit
MDPFKKFEKELNKSGYFISTDMIVNSRGDVVGQMDPYGTFQYNDDLVEGDIVKIINKPDNKATTPLKPKTKKKTSLKSKIYNKLTK